MTITFPGESPEYRAARNRLLDLEIRLRRDIEAVAEERRRLPPGGAVPEDYAFEEVGPERDARVVHMSELFAAGRDSLILYSFMFPRDPDDDRPGPTSGRTAQLPLAQGPCPSCVSLLDQLDGAVEHTAPLLNFAVVAKAPAEHLHAFAAERGWRRLRLVSSGRNTYNRDYHGENADGAQRPMLNVFQREGGEIRHFWASELFYAPTEPGQDPRHLGTIEALWNLLDLTPGGRPAVWDEQLSYGRA